MNSVHGDRLPLQCQNQRLPAASHSIAQLGCHWRASGAGRITYDVMLSYHPVLDVSQREKLAFTQSRDGAGPVGLKHLIHLRTT